MEHKLFNDSKPDTQITLEHASQISGLEIYFDFISEAEENNLILNIDQNQWLNDLKRRVQHYGYKYNYKARRIDESFYIGEMPEWMDFLFLRLNAEKQLEFIPDQAIINEYVDNQGITPHIDCEPCFGDTIISVSLAGYCVMTFQSKDDGMLVHLLVPPRTLIIMKGESRYRWLHGIPQRKTDMFNGNLYKRSRRLSITLRKVILV